jgi:hypothetical protein
MVTFCATCSSFNVRSQRHHVSVQARAPAGGLSVTEQKFAEAVSGAELVSLGRFTRADEVTQGLVLGVGYEHRGEVAGTQSAGEPHGISAIGLDAITAPDGDQGRGDHFAMDAELDELPVQHKPGRPGFVADAQGCRVTESFQQLLDGFGAVGNLAQRPHLAARFRNRYRNRRGVYIQADVSGILLHDRLPSRVALHSVLRCSERNLRSREAKPVVP